MTYPTLAQDHTPATLPCQCSEQFLSIHHAAEGFESAARQRVARLDRQRVQKLVAGAIDQALGKVGPAQIEIGKVPGIISFCRDRPLEPGYGFVKAFQPDEICTDIVVGIAEFRVHLDGALALCDCVINFSLEVEGPSEKSVSLGGRVQG